MLVNIPYYGKFSKCGQQNMIGDRGTNFDMRHHYMHLHTLQKPSNESFSSCLPKFVVPYMKVGSTKALNR